MPWLTFVSEIAWKATAILAIAWTAEMLLRRIPASLRHFVWTAAFAGLLGLPIANLVSPRLTPPRSAPPPAAAASAVRLSAPARRLSSGQTAPPQPSRLTAILSAVWLAGCLAAASRFAAGAARTSWMVRRAAPARFAQPVLAELTRSLGVRRTVRTLATAATPMPLTWGLLRPVVLLPSDAVGWPEARLHTVLLHELVHIRRLDVLSQSIAQIACCLYWFHPLAWVGWRRLCQQRERACDDAVLARGVAAHEYAGHLLDLVRALVSKRSRWADAPAMAESSDLESRIRALLDRQRNRRPLSRRAALAVTSVAVALLVPLAAIHAQGDRGWLTGSVSDPSGARVPHCRVTAKNLEGSNQEVVVADDSGDYRFPAIPAGHYTLEFAAPGFAIAKTQAFLIAGTSARVDAHLELGAVSEMVVIRGQKPAATSAPRVSASTVTVGGKVEPAKLIRQPRPVYSPELQQQGVEGTVIMSAIISTSGTVLSPTVRNTVDPRLAAAALEAVRQWVYQPAMLNGQPVETVMTITLEFQLGLRQ